MKWTQVFLVVAVGGAMIAAGVTHFVNPGPFLKMVPPWLPAPEALVAISGAFEILGGVGVLVPKTRRFAAYGLIALYVAVFPANLYMAVAKIQFDPANPIPEWIAWARLPFQFLFIWLAWRVSRLARPVSRDA